MVAKVAKVHRVLMKKKTLKIDHLVPKDVSHIMVQNFGSPFLFLFDNFFSSKKRKTISLFHTQTGILSGLKLTDNERSRCSLLEGMCCVCTRDRARERERVHAPLAN